MADDGTPSDESAPRARDRAKKGKLQPTPGDLGAPIREYGKGAGRLDLDDPDALPPYVDPHGRTIMPRHKRQALRTAREMNLRPKGHNHAMHLLAARDIDFLEDEDSMLSLADKAGRGGQSDSLTVLQNPDTENLLAEDAGTAGRRQLAISDAQTRREAAVTTIQRDLVRRRRRRLFAMLLRLAVFVFIPTAVVAWYYFDIATPMFETESEFVIQTSDNAASAGGLGGLLAGTGFATSQDSIVVQGFLGSREAFLRLDRDHDYVSHFQDPAIDRLQRLPEDATLDEAYAYFQDKVTIGYDPTEGIVRMGVVAASPEASQTFSEALVGYAEERVDGLTQEARGDQLQTATENYLEAEAKMLEAEQRVLDLQQQRGVLSADVELQSQMSIINSLELELESKRLALAEMKDNARPNESRVSVQEREIERLAARIKELRGDLTQTNDSSVSLARISGELRIAESDLATRHTILQQAIASMETARLEASRQVRYLSMGVAPVAPVEPTFPRKIEGTILAFVLFAGIYILASLTVSILREQVSV
ncbi:capsule biosynthesis protein [Rhodobacteraceae bacterium 2CG4]|uniref:Capsule biosynthesis protein n=1 Tax=Halovulum marinum TaxID=2662447 RepID=A0A6L5YZM7_9RHOB|nr:capsule biosynthesis protein [Halovulum marinum]MSU89184.1 capsule biosynthesis protein [Halovulum marinum]